MSPLTRKRKAKQTAEWKVRAGGEGIGKLTRYVTVNAEEEPRIRVTWVESCANRYFNPAELKELILLIDGLLTAHPGMWLADKDAQGRTYFVCLTPDGRLIGNDSAQEGRGRGSVPWEELKDAFEAALEALDSRE